MLRRYFITAIGTDSGKTLVSAIFTEAFQADYWKPVQAGFPTDSQRVKELVSNKNTVILPEKYVLKTPASPHAAAVIDQLNIKVADFGLPHQDKNLIIEGAGGIMVPLNDQETMGNLMVYFGLPVVLVSNLYLGSINHTLLSVAYLKELGVEVAGLVFNGEPNPASESVIQSMTGLKVLLRIPHLSSVNKAVVKKYASLLKKQLPS